MHDRLRTPGPRPAARGGTETASWVAGRFGASHPVNPREPVVHDTLTKPDIVRADDACGVACRTGRAAASVPRPVAGQHAHRPDPVMPATTSGMAAV